MLAYITGSNLQLHNSVLIISERTLYLRPVLNKSFWPLLNPFTWRAIDVNLLFRILLINFSELIT